MRRRFEVSWVDFEWLPSLVTLRETILIGTERTKQRRAGERRWGYYLQTESDILGRYIVVIGGVRVVVV